MSPSSRQVVAIKVLPDAVAAEPDRISRFEREAQLLASLNHPNIAVIRDFQQDDGRQLHIVLNWTEELKAKSQVR